jgi:hypothetical protein
MKKFFHEAADLIQDAVRLFKSAKEAKKIYDDWTGLTHEDFT